MFFYSDNLLPLPTFLILLICTADGEASPQVQETRCDDGQLRNVTAPPCCWDDPSGTRFFLGRDGLCKMCVVCTAGFGHDKPCGDGQFGDAVCTQCPEGYYSSTHGYDCTPCRICEHTEIEQECTSTTDRICGGCRPGYYRDPQNPDLCNQKCEWLTNPQEKSECIGPVLTETSISKNDAVAVTNPSLKNAGGGYSHADSVVIILLVFLVPVVIILAVAPICMCIHHKRSQHLKQCTSRLEEGSTLLPDGTGDEITNSNHAGACHGRETEMHQRSEVDQDSADGGAALLGVPRENGSFEGQGEVHQLSYPGEGSPSGDGTPVADDDGNGNGKVVGEGKWEEAESSLGNGDQGDTSCMGCLQPSKASGAQAQNNVCRTEELTHTTKYTGQDVQGGGQGSDSGSMMSAVGDLRSNDVQVPPGDDGNGRQGMTDKGTNCTLPKPAVHKHYHIEYVDTLVAGDQHNIHNPPRGDCCKFKSEPSNENGNNDRLVDCQMASSSCCDGDIASERVNNSNDSDEGDDHADDEEEEVDDNRDDDDADYDVLSDDEDDSDDNSVMAVKI